MYYEKGIQQSNKELWSEEFSNHPLNIISGFKAQHNSMRIPFIADVNVLSCGASERFIVPNTHSLNQFKLVSPV